LRRSKERRVGGAKDEVFIWQLGYTDKVTHIEKKGDAHQKGM